jgi:hypothetical protein
MVMVIAGAALNSRVAAFPVLFHQRWLFAVSWSAVVCFCIVSSVAFVLVKMLGLFEGILALHRLRGELVISSAKREAAEKAAAMQREAEITTPIVPADYGQLVQHH